MTMLSAVAVALVIVMLTIIASLAAVPYYHRRQVERYYNDPGLLEQLERKVSPTWRTDVVPRVIHQTAPSDRTRWKPQWEECHRSWRRLYPDYEHRMWTDEDVDAFVRERFPSFYPTFLAYPKHIMRIDVFRYLLLFELGGVYADMDYECVRDFWGAWIKPGRAHVAESAWASGAYENALMASPPRHPFWRGVMESVLQRTHLTDPIAATGPHVIDAGAAKAPDQVIMLPTALFSRPPDRAVPPPTDAATGVFAVHHGTCSWCDSK